MAEKLSELPSELKAITIYTIMKDENHPALIDGTKNSTGHDLALFFSDSHKAFAYRDRFPSLRHMEVYLATVAEMEAIFEGEVEYYVFNP